MFRPLSDSRAGAAASQGAQVDFTFDGRPLSARAGSSVAAALLANGVAVCRATPVSGAPRAPYCLMGVCFDCLVVIDGVGNRQGCMVALRAGMRVATQPGLRQIGEQA